jgi:hypothetical protein
MSVGRAMYVGNVSAAADYMAPGAIEINRYQQEIFDLVRRRGVFGQRIPHTPATGQPSRWFEQTAIPTATYSDPRILAPVASQPTRAERVVTLKALLSQINYGIFDVEINQQQGAFAYLEAKDLSDTVDGVLKLHDQGLWTGSDTDLTIPTTTQYFGCSGQIAKAAQVGAVSQLFTISSTGSLIDGIKDQTANMISRTDYEVRPDTIYANPLFGNLIDKEAKTVQLYFDKVEVMPGVVVKALPTQAGILPMVPDPFITNFASGAQTQYAAFILTESCVEYHWLTSPMPRVFQLGLLGNLASQYVVVKFGAVVVKGAAYTCSLVTSTR